MRLAPSLALVLAALAVAAAAAAPLVAQEEPLTAGSEGVPAPKRTKHVQPVYPQEALAQGIRGIVILEIILDEKGKVESTTVMRSVPGLDEAAIAAAQKWEYTPTKVDGKPVRVRVTVPVVFSLALPTLSRQAGVPELRQGVSPAWPAGASGGGLARAEVTLEADGRVGAARILEGEPPWSEALLAALKTWRFAPPPEDEVLTFRVEAEFLSEGGGKGDRRVSLEATGLQRSGLLEGPPASAPAPAPPTAVAGATPAAPAPLPAEPRHAPDKEQPATEQPAPAPPESAQPKPTQPAPPATEQPAPAQPQPAPAPTAPAQPTPAAPLPAAPAEAGREAPPSQGRPATPSATADTTAPPPVEVITAPPPAPPPESGISAIRDVMLEPGVPDLTRGRRPVAPPFARMAGATGTVEVAFSVGTSGTTTLQSASGPDLLKPAAEQAVASWVFRRTRADRAYLVAVFTYTGDKSSAVVRPQGAPPAPTPAPTGSAAPPASGQAPTGTAAPPQGGAPPGAAPQEP